MTAAIAWAPVVDRARAGRFKKLIRSSSIVCSPIQPRMIPHTEVPTWVVDRYSVKLETIVSARSILRLFLPRRSSKFSWASSRAVIRVCTKANSAATKKAAKIKVIKIMLMLVMIFWLSKITNPSL